MSVILPLSRRVRTASVDHYPELRPFVKAVGRKDWPALSRLLDGLAPDVDATYVAVTLADIEGSERFFAKLADTQRSSPWPRILLGERHVKLAWKARSGLRAKYVSREQFQVFFEHLQVAERVLGSVTADEPDNPVAWSLRLVTARGLQFGLDECRRRYERAACLSAQPIFAQRQMVQALCPKWVGTLPDLVAFTEECAKAAPDGSMGAGLTVETVFEQMAELDTGSAFLKRPEVVEQCLEAERRSTGHPDWRPLLGWVITRNAFAYYWSYTGHPQKAAPHFEALGRRLAFPWPNAFGDKLGAERFLERRAAARRAAR